MGSYYLCFHFTLHVPFALVGKLNYFLCPVNFPGLWSCCVFPSVFCLLRIFCPLFSYGSIIIHSSASCSRAISESLLYLPLGKMILSSNKPTGGLGEFKVVPIVNSLCLFFFLDTFFSHKCGLHVTFLTFSCKISNASLGFG